MRMRWPSWMPAGTSTSIRCSSTVRPAPPQVSHLCSMRRPVPAQSGHCDWRTNSPKIPRETCWTQPPPPQRVQPMTAEPGAAPSPWHVAQTAARSSGTSTLMPCAESASVISISAATSPPRAAPPPRRPPKSVVPEERAEQVAERAEVEARRLEPTGTKTGVAVAIVELASLGIGERLVGLGDLAEAHLGVRHVGDVRMELARELAEGLLDRLLVRVAGNSEELVVIALCRRHGAHIVPVRVALTGSGLDYSSP